MQTPRRPNEAGALLVRAGATCPPAMAASGRIGNKLGLYKAMDGAAPGARASSRSDGCADARREWLNAQPGRRRRLPA